MSSLLISIRACGCSMTRGLAWCRSRSWPAPIRGSIGLSLISRMLIGDLPWSFPVQSFLGTNIAWTGGAAKAAAIGISRPRSIWKAGYARRCFGIFQRRRSTSMFKSKLGNDGHRRKVSGFDCYSLMALLRKLARSLKHWTIPTRVASRHSLTSFRTNLMWTHRSSLLPGFQELPLSRFRAAPSLHA
jgi:hypothetical protein